MSLCLVKAAKFTRLRLNREIITLLQSARCTQNNAEFDVSEAVTEIQEHELDLLVKMLYDRTEAERRLSGMLDASWIAAASVAGVDICTEPFWARLLRVVYKRAVRSLRSKTHLPVEKACMLMGVPDPEGVLGEDEISIRSVLSKAISMNIFLLTLLYISDLQGLTPTLLRLSLDLCSCIVTHAFTRGIFVL
jgi:hypothetical protein